MSAPRPTRSSPRRGRGLTLVEVLVTLVVIVSILGPIFMMMSRGTLRVYRGGDETLATMYAAEIMETIRGAPYGVFQPDDQEMTPEQIFREHNIPEGTDIEKYDERFQIRAKVSPIEGYDPRDIKRIQVTVTWEDRANKQLPKSATLTTFYTPVN